MSAKSVSRFAPSPTGRLHLGHAYSALLAHDLARSSNGKFLLRIEDIDQTRCRPDHVNGIFEDLAWLGLDWDGDVAFQSDRQNLYRAALDHLVTQGLAYRCWCTRAEIAADIDAPQDGGPPVYPGTCKGRAEPADGRPYSWRLDVAEASRRSGKLTWQDASAGAVVAQPDRLGDVVLARKDAPAAYHLAVVVDDDAQGVTDVVRGRDLFDSTHIHRLLQHLLSCHSPNYHHHQLVVGADGLRLAKRKSAPALTELRRAGVDPHQFVAGLRAGVLPDGFFFSD